MDYENEVAKRVQWIKDVLGSAHAKGIVLGMSGGKDCALVAILSKMATPNVVGIIMPIESSRNYKEDRDDAFTLCKQFDIEVKEVDLTDVKKLLRRTLEPLDEENPDIAYQNINPRLRMITLYNYGQRKGYLVAGTGNKSERTMGYFTKWGDGAYDFNPIGDMTATEIFKMLKYLDCPQNIIDKAPSAGLYEGQTDENDFGVTYKELDTYILTGNATDRVKEIVDKAYNRTKHKRENPRIYPN
ncbi:MAG TPA: NAD(+) synthase [Clostridia bacterium]|jgi:NAD+ synthase|nr:NAD(+) synthase [Clostridia bacterium]